MEFHGETTHDYCVHTPYVTYNEKIRANMKIWSRRILTCIVSFILFLLKTKNYSSEKKVINHKNMNCQVIQLQFGTTLLSNVKTTKITRPVFFRQVPHTIMFPNTKVRQHVQRWAYANFTMWVCCAITIALHMIQKQWWNNNERFIWNIDFWNISGPVEWIEMQIKNVTYGFMIYEYLCTTRGAIVWSSRRNWEEFCYFHTLKLIIKYVSQQGSIIFFSLAYGHT